jgi:hypothetical protein
MGHRANFVVIRNGHAKAYTDQWAALGAAYSFAAGPEVGYGSLVPIRADNRLMSWAC